MGKQPFLSFGIPIELPGPINAEGEAVEGQEKTVNLEIPNPANIESFNEAYYGGTLITMSSGVQYITRLKPDQLRAHIALFYERLGQLAAQAAASPGIILQQS